MKKIIAILGGVFVMVYLLSGIGSEKDKYKKACQELEKVQIAIDIYHTDEMKLPKVDNFDELTMLVPKYLEKLPEKDPWGNDYLIKFGKKYNDETYWIASAGSDGKFQDWDQEGTYKDFKGKDIIFSMAGMVYGPKYK